MEKIYDSDSFFKKPGKIGSCNFESWAGMLMRRLKLSLDDASKKVHDMIANGDLIPAED
jgi:hypothetical protein